MRKHGLIILIAVAIILCLVTLSNADVVKSNIVKRKDTPYTNYGGLYNVKDKKKKKKHKHQHRKRHLKPEIIKKRDEVPEPDLGEVSVREDDKAVLLKKRQVPESTGHVDVNKIFTNTTGNP